MASVVLSASVLSGCKGRSGKNKDITDEAGLVLSGSMPDKLPDGISWYDFEENTDIFDLFKKEYGDYYVSDISFFEGHTYCLVHDNDIENSVLHFVSLDKDSQIVSDYIFQDELGKDISVHGLIKGNNLYVSVMDWDAGHELLYFIDPATGKPDPDQRLDIDKTIPSNDYYCSCEFTGDKLVILSMNDTDYRVSIFDTVGKNVEKTIELKGLQKDYGITWLDGICCGGTDKVVVWGGTSSNLLFGQTRYVVLDLASGLTEALDEKSFITIPLRNLSSCDGRLVSATDSGVYEIDLDNDTCKLKMSFNFSNCNRYLVNNSELSYADDDMMVFDYSSRYAGMGQLSNALCIFKKSDSYPAAGKQIMTVASTEDLDYAVSESIMRFNDQSDTSFLVFDGRYKANTEIDYSNSDDTDAAALNSLGIYASVSDKLAMDIMSGEGPDILITNGANEQLSRSEYFIDLSDYLSKESSIDSSDYFMNVFEASKYNGALYQLPIGFYVDGFISSSENFGGKNGMTFDEYQAMVKTVCNGADPVYDHQLSYSRAELATRLFANMNELFITDGKIDVNNEAFKAILDYCKDLPAKGYYEDKNLDADFEDYISASEKLIVRPCRVSDYFEFEEFSKRYPDGAICGYPSIDGRPASVGSDLAVSISSQSDDIDSCKQFVSMLLSEDIQRSIGSNIPVNKKCAREMFLAEIRLNNENVGKYEDSAFAFEGKIIDESVADLYVDELSKASTSGFVYHNISLIIYEEIPAYFEGQKSFDEVCSTINDRAQTVLNERG